MIYLKYLVFLSFWLLPPDIFAGVFDVIPTDKSKEYLGIIFGGSVGAVTLGGGANPILSKMFERFNFIIITFGVLVLSYIGVVAAINTAREGEAMGRKFSLWVPLRALSGMLMMLPSPGTGYSVIQMTVIWIVLNGIGAANAVWNVVLDQLASGIRVVGSVDFGGVDMETQVNDLTEDILKMAVCKNVANQMTTDFMKDYGPVVVSFPTVDSSLGKTITATEDLIEGGEVILHKGDIKSYEVSATFEVGVPNKPICGSSKVVIILNYNDPDFSMATALTYLQIKLMAVKAIFDVVEPSAVMLSTPLTSKIPKITTTINGRTVKVFPPPPTGIPNTFSTAYKNYMAQIIQLVPTPKTNQDSKLAQELTILKSFGWIHAGGFYYALTQGNKASALNATRELEPIMEPPSSSFDTSDSSSDQQAGPKSWNEDLRDAVTGRTNTKDLNMALKYAEDFAEKDKQDATGLPSLDSGYPSTRNKFLNKILRGVLKNIRTPILKFFSANLTGQAGDPLLSIGSFGSNLMLAGEIAVFGLVVTASLIMLAVSSGSCLNPLPWAIQTLFFTVVPGLATILVLLWAMGATLGIYVPMVPYLVFTATAIGWMLIVIEAVVGAPIIALGLVQPSGEELGKVAPALGILITIFLKPVLMIFGFVIAGSLLRGILTMINFGFIGSLNAALPTPTFFSIMPTLALYTFLIVSVVNQAFSLIYELPNKVLRYMGVQPEGSSPEKLLGEAKGGFDKGASAGQQALKGQAEKGMEKWSAAREKRQGKKGGDLPEPH